MASHIKNTLRPFSVVVQIGNLQLTLHDSAYVKFSTKEMHCHPYYEMFFNMFGTTTIMSEEVHHIIHENDLFVFCKNKQHCRYDMRESANIPVRFTYRRVQNEKSDIFTPFNELMTSPDGVIIFRNLPEVRSIFSEIERDSSLRTQFEVLLMQSHITHLVLELLRLYTALPIDVHQLEITEASQRLFFCGKVVQQQLHEACNRWGSRPLS